MLGPELLYNCVPVYCVTSSADRSIVRRFWSVSCLTGDKHSSIVPNAEVVPFQGSSCSCTFSCVLKEHAAANRFIFRLLFISSWISTPTRAFTTFRVSSAAIRINRKFRGCSRASRILWGKCSSWKTLTFKKSGKEHACLFKMDWWLFEVRQVAVLLVFLKDVFLSTRVLFFIF